jgi:hypothetical protein
VHGHSPEQACVGGADSVGETVPQHEIERHDLRRGDLGAQQRFYSVAARGEPEAADRGDPSVQRLSDGPVDASTAVHLSADLQLCVCLYWRAAEHAQVSRHRPVLEGQGGVQPPSQTQPRLAHPGLAGARGQREV